MIGISRPSLGAEEQDAVREVLESGHIASGPRTVAFEDAFAEACGTEHALLVNSGTAAVEVALRATGVSPGDEVLTTPFSFIASVNPLLLMGARPRFVDVDPRTYTLDPDLLEAAVTEKTKAILAVHLYGLPAGMDAVREVAERHDLAVVEDACQAHGATYRGKPAGGLGDVAAFSFYATKNLTMGEGGAVTTDDDEVAAFVRSYRNHGRPPSTGLGTYEHVQCGNNFRTSDIHAAIGLVQLRRLGALNEQRRRNAERLSRALAGVVPAPFVPPDVEPSWHQYTLRVHDRDRFVQEMRDRGVQCGVYYPRVLYEYPHLAEYASPCPEAERAAREVVSLPVHPSLTEAELDAVAEAVRDVLAHAPDALPDPVPDPVP